MTFGTFVLILILLFIAVVAIGIMTGLDLSDIFFFL